MDWSTKRKLFFIGILIIFFGVIIFLIIYPKLNKIPTCVDGKQNGLETGIDCGGNCPLVCSLGVNDISILWSRAFRVVPGRYNAVAYLQNTNQNAVINKINYRFRFADKDNVYIGKREGSAYIPPAGNFAIFESAIDVGNSVPVFTTFEFTEEPVWLQVDKEKVNQIKIEVSDILLENQNTSPKLSAVVKNNSLFKVPEISFITILSDISGNAVSASRSYLDFLENGKSTIINFTWIEPFREEVISKEIIPIFNIFSTTL